MTISFLERRSGQDRRKCFQKPSRQGSFTDIYELLLNNSNLVLSELLELDRLLHRKITTLTILEERGIEKRRPHRV
jgi:hypothetical protein